MEESKDNTGTDQFSQATDWLRETNDFLVNDGVIQPNVSAGASAHHPEEDGETENLETHDDGDGEDDEYSDDSLGINDSDFVVGVHAENMLLKKRMGQELRPPQRLDNSPKGPGEIRDKDGAENMMSDSKEETKSLQAGTRVLARYSGGLTKYEGEITLVGSDGRYTILYDDGEEEQNVPLEYIEVLIIQMFFL
jgi:hypothetical protein